MVPQALVRAAGLVPVAVLDNLVVPAAGAVLAVALAAVVLWRCFAVWI